MKRKQTRQTTPTSGGINLKKITRKTRLQENYLRLVAQELEGNLLRAIAKARSDLFDLVRQCTVVDQRREAQLVAFQHQSTEQNRLLRELSQGWAIANAKLKRKGIP